MKAVISLQEDVLDTFYQSFDKCRDNPEFMVLFYDRFVNGNPEIQALFEGVDVTRVRKMVRDALFMVLMASDGSEFAARKIETLASQHKEMALQASHLDLWMESLLSVVEEVDQRFNPKIAESWRKVMGVGLEIFKRNLAGQGPTRAPIDPA